MLATNSIQFRTEHTAHTLRIFRPDSNAPLVTQHAPQNSRPFIHPIVAPDGQGVLTENEPAHHPWQHGLYVGLNDVNGVGFWTEGLRNDPNDGTFHPQPLAAPRLSADLVEWTVRTEWRTPHAPTKAIVPSAAMLHETQRWSLRDSGTSYTLDLEWTLTAAMDLTFGRYAYGGLFLRMPYKAGIDAHALTSGGLIGTAGEAQRAKWVAVSMPIEGRVNPAGIAIMDHPGNPEHPVPWRIDGQLGIAPSRCIAGAWQLARRASVTFRHRVLMFCGAINPQQIEASYVQFSR